MRSSGVLSIACALAVIAACGSEVDATDEGGPGSSGGPVFGDPDGGGGDASKATPCDKNADCASGVCNLATKTCGCGGASVAAEIVPPNILIVLDRSCSMTEKVGGVTKWEIAVAAIKALIAKNSSKIRFGLELFPDTNGDACTQGAISIPVGPTTGAQISALLTAALAKVDPLFPDGPCVTNIDTAMTRAATEPAFADKSRKSFVLLVTDGAQANCADNVGDSLTTTTITNLRKKGVGTFVVGFGGAVDTNQMNIFATEGGEPNPKGPPTFYDAANGASLDAAFATIANKSLSCTLKLASPPPGGDASLIYVFVDKNATPVPRDTTRKSHWDYDPDGGGAVTFYGPDCDALKSGTTSQVSVVFGCEGGPPPDNPVK